MTGSVFVPFVAALLILVAVLARWRRATRRRPERVETNVTPLPAGATPDVAAEVLDYLRRLEARGSPGLAAEVIGIFLQDTAARLTTLRNAIGARDGETVSRVGHTLQGSASMIGADSVARGCAALTKSGRSGSFDQCEAIVSALDVHFEAIQRALAGPASRRMTEEAAETAEKKP